MKGSLSYKDAKDLPFDELNKLMKCAYKIEKDLERQIEIKRKNK